MNFFIGKENEGCNKEKAEESIQCESPSKKPRKASSTNYMEEESDEYISYPKDEFFETPLDDIDATRTPAEESKSKKFVFYSSSKKLVFGFDKVENLIDDHVLEDINRDILKEIDHTGNFEQPCFKNCDL